MSDGRRAVFLDRDGVINRTVVRNGRPHPPDRVEDLEILPGVREAIARLHDQGFRLIVVTNQPDVARGTQRRDVIDAMHAVLAAELAIDEFRVCDHDGDGCHCRKPKPGMMLDAARESGINLSESYLVGDRWRDIEAGHRAGCTSIFIDYGYAEKRPEGQSATVGSLAEAAEWILNARR